MRSLSLPSWALEQVREITKVIMNHLASVPSFRAVEAILCVQPIPASLGCPGGSVVKNPPANAGDAGLIPGSGRSPGEGNSNPLWYSCLENPMDRRAWWATVHGVEKGWTRQSN